MQIQFFGAILVIRSTAYEIVLEYLSCLSCFLSYFWKFGWETCSG